MARERPFVSRFVRGSLLAAAASAALALAGPDALVPFKDAAGAASEVSVAFVLDFGGSTGVVSGCVKVPSTDNGYEALAAFAAQEHESAPTYNASGLLCSINGVPNSGCGQVVGGGYVYWSYFHGLEGTPWTWRYASGGAFATVGTWNGQADDVEGWRFQDPGTGLPNDPPPRSTPDYSDICGSGTPSTTTTVVTGTTAPTGSTTTRDTQGRSGSLATTTTTGRAVGHGETAPPTRTAGVSPSTPAPGGPSTSAPSTTPSSGSPSAAGAGGPVSTTPPTGFPDGQAQSLRATPSPSGGGTGGSAAPLVAVLAAGAVFRWRRRPGAP